MSKLLTALALVLLASSPAMAQEGEVTFTEKVSQKANILAELALNEAAIAHMESVKLSDAYKASIFYFAQKLEAEVLFLDVTVNVPHHHAVAETDRGILIVSIGVADIDGILTGDYVTVGSLVEFGF
ncbi:MAG: hypothetical protein AAF533_14000 [Acidobacteriota bacterium]